MKERFDELVELLMDKGFFMEEAIELLEKSLLERALICTRGNQSAASKMLGIHRNTLQKKMLDYQIENRGRSRTPADSSSK